MLQPALADLKRAYSNFFARQAKFPRFKSKKHSRLAFRIPQRVRVLNACRLRVSLAEASIAG